jgi:hypothetical protein
LGCWKVRSKLSPFVSFVVRQNLLIVQKLLPSLFLSSSFPNSANGVVYASWAKNTTTGKPDLLTVASQQTVNGVNTIDGSNLRGIQIENCNVFGVSAPQPNGQTYPKFIYTMSEGPISGFNVGKLPSSTSNTGLKVVAFISWYWTLLYWIRKQRLELTNKSL